MRIEEEEEKERRNGQFKRLFSKEGIKESGVAKSFRGAIVYFDLEHHRLGSYAA